ncbi:hypothetical protein D3C72_1344830 [compost metagenome]
MQAEQAGHEMADARLIVQGKALPDERLQRLATLALATPGQLQGQRLLAADACQCVCLIYPGQFHGGTSVECLSRLLVLILKAVLSRAVHIGWVNRGLVGQRFLHVRSAVFAAHSLALSAA